MSYITSLLCLLFCTGWVGVSANNSTEEPVNDSALIEQLLVNYDKYEAPPHNRSTLDRMYFGITDFHFTDQLTMEFTTTFLLGQHWYDPRLAFANKTSSIYVRENAVDRIWKPDLFIWNQKTSSIHELFSKHHVMMISPGGNVTYWTTVSATAFCTLHLQHFPFDWQVCPIIFQSRHPTWQLECYDGIVCQCHLARHCEKIIGIGLRYDMNTIQLVDSVRSIDVLFMPSFQITNLTAYNCSEKIDSGSYPCLMYLVVVHRYTGFYLLNIYFPSILVVILSWLSFWLNSNASVSRMLLGLMSILFMAIITFGVDTQLPKISYVTFLDVWTNVCFFFTFAVLFEYAAVYFLANKLSSESRQSSVNEEIAMTMNFQRMKEPTMDDRISILPMESKRVNWSDRIDFLSRIIFPSLFLFFNIVYWSVCANFEEGE